MKHPRKAHTSQADGCKMISDRDHIAAPIGPIAMDQGLALPCRMSELSQIRPGSDAATLICLTQWLGEKGLYVLLTPEGARQFAANLIEVAGKADAANAELTATALARITGKGGAS